MRALLVCAAPQRGSIGLVLALASSADLVIAVDGGGALCRRARVQPDLLVGDMDSLRPSDVAALEAGGATVLRFPADKDDSDLALALTAARDRGVSDVVVTAASTGRLDHTLAALAALAGASDLRPTLMEPDFEAFVLASAGRDVLNVRCPEATMSLIAFGGTACVSVQGVRWPLERFDLVPTTTRGLSNVITGADEAVVTVHEGTVIAVVRAASNASSGWRV